MQYHKLQIPPGDHELAYRALRLIMEIREGRYTLSPDGRILASGGVEVPLPPFAEVRLSGPTARPSLPAKLSPLSASGPLRDLLADLSYLANNNPKNAGHGFDRTYEDVRKRIAEIRREARIEVHQLLGDSHPAAKNLEEIVVRYKPDQEAELSAWTAEFSASVAEAARSVEIMSSRNRPTGQ